MCITIKEISPEETYQLRHEVMWPNKPLEYIKLKNDDKGIHFGLWKDSNLVSVISVFIHEHSAQFRKFATSKLEQGNGYGGLLLKYILTNIDNNNVEKIWCNARADKTAFYEKFGLYKTLKTFSKDRINYVIMEKPIKPISPNKIEG